MFNPLTMVMGGALSAVATLKGPEAETGAMAAAMRDKERQADEVEYRGQRDAELIRKQGDKLLGQQASAFVASGVDLSGSALVVMEDTNRRIQDDVYDTFHEMRFRSDQLRRGAASIGNAINARNEAAFWQIAAGAGSKAFSMGTLLGGSSGGGGSDGGIDEVGDFNLGGNTYA